MPGCCTARKPCKRTGPLLAGRLQAELPPFRPSGRSSGVEHNLAKVGVEGSNPFARSRPKQPPISVIESSHFLCGSPKPRARSALAIEGDEDEHRRRADPEERPAGHADRSFRGRGPRYLGGAQRAARRHVRALPENQEIPLAR